MLSIRGIEGPANPSASTSPSGNERGHQTLNTIFPIASCIVKAASRPTPGGIFADSRFMQSKKDLLPGFDICR